MHSFTRLLQLLVPYLVFLLVSLLSTWMGKFLILSVTPAIYFGCCLFILVQILTKQQSSWYSRMEMAICKFNSSLSDSNPDFLTIISRYSKAWPRLWLALLFTSSCLTTQLRPKVNSSTSRSVLLPATVLPWRVLVLHKVPTSRSASGLRSS